MARSIGFRPVETPQGSVIGGGISNKIENKFLSGMQHFCSSMAA
jgi:hypothetical protein